MRIKLEEGVKAPAKGRPGDAGWDLFLKEDVVLGGGITVIPTGVSMQIPGGYAGLLAIRSSVAKTGLILQNPLIDSNYRGEIHAIVLNLTGKTLVYKKGERICSLYVFPLYKGELDQVSELDPSDRGDAWAGSSGR